MNITLSLFLKKTVVKIHLTLYILKYCKNNLSSVYQQYEKKKNQENIKYITYLQYMLFKKKMPKVTINEIMYCIFRLISYAKN